MIILASTSIYRKAQLETLGLKFHCVSPNVDEEAIKNQNLSTLEKAEALALLKARAVQEKHPDATIIGGDQIVSIENTVLSKPMTRKKNIEQLLYLQGRTHFLYNSNVILKGGEVFTHTEVAELKMKPLVREQIEAYVDYAEPMDSAGGYKIEVGGIALFDSIKVADSSAIQGINLLFVAEHLLNDCWRK